MNDYDMLKVAEVRLDELRREADQFRIMQQLLDRAVSKHRLGFRWGSRRRSR